MLPGDVTWGIEAGVDVGHELLSQSTGVVEDAAKEPQTREVSPELQQICHPLRGRHRVQPDIGVADMYAFLGQVRICGQAFGDPNVGGQPFQEYWNHIPSSIMAVHLSPLQSGHDVCSVDRGIVPKHLETPHRFVHGAEGAPYLMSALRDVAVAVHENFLLFSLPPLQVSLKCLTLVLLLLPLALLAISGLVSCRDQNFFAFGAALALSVPSPMSVQTPAAPHWFIRFPLRGLGTFVPVHRCRGRRLLRLCPHVVTSIHLPARHWQRTALRGRKLLGG